MTLSRRTLLAFAVTAPLIACTPKLAPAPKVALNPGETPEMRALIRKYAAIHDIPESLIHRVVQRESDYNAGARNGPYYGLMQILPQTARGMEFAGKPNDLLNAETNLQYAGKYLKGAWMVSGGDEHAAMLWYAKGYYYEAKRLGLLDETGLRT